MRALALVLTAVATACVGADSWKTGPSPDRVAPRPEAAADAGTLSGPPAPWRGPFGIELQAAPQVYFETSREGRELCYWVLGAGEETVLVFGGIHGDERSSSELAFCFLAWLEQHPEQLRGRRLVVAPASNPDGLAQGVRGNARGVDLNRNFPAQNWRPQGAAHRPGLHPRSEPETRFLLFLLQVYSPARVVTLHGAAGCINWDGPARELAAAMALRCGLPARASIGYPTPGSFGSYLGIDLGIPVITFELSRNDRIAPDLERCLGALELAIHAPAAEHP